MTRLTIPMIACFIVSSCASSPSRWEGPLIELRLVHDSPGEGVERVELEGESLYLEERRVVSDPDLEMARPIVVQDRLLIGLRLTSEGGRRLARLTAENIGRRIAVLIEGRVRSVTVIPGAVNPEPMLGAIELPEHEADRITGRIRARWPGERVREQDAAPLHPRFDEPGTSTMFQRTSSPYVHIPKPRESSCHESVCTSRRESSASPTRSSAEFRYGSLPE